MSQKATFETVQKLIVSLKKKLHTFKNDFPELLEFIEGLDSINFSSTHQLVGRVNQSKDISELLNLVCLNQGNHQLNGLDYRHITNYNWMNIYHGIDTKHSFIDGMFAARFLGLDGYYASTSISAGLMLILPGVIYPFHSHSVKEFYYCLSGKLLIRHNICGEKFSLAEGQISVTPEGKLHSLEVIGKKPVLLVYSWLGNLDTPITIWEKMKSGRWQGYTWKRFPGQEWKSSGLQQLSNEEFLGSFDKNF